MKLTEIMVIRKDNGEDRMKVFQVDDKTLTRLTRIRGSFYKDDPRLQVVEDLPTPEPQIEISQAALESLDRALNLRRLMMDAKITTSPRVIEPEPKPMTFEEQLAHDWRHSPSLRREFTSFGSYRAFMGAEKAGRTKLYGCKS